MSKLLDANVILRYLLDDIKSQSEAAESAIKSGAVILPEVLAEVVYVLDGVYSVSRGEISAVLTELLSEVEMRDKAVILYALKLYAGSSFDFVDCVLASHAKVLGSEVMSFDKALVKAIAQII